MTNTELVQEAERILLGSQITGRQYAGRLKTGTTAKSWDDAFALLAQVQDVPEPVTTGASLPLLMGSNSETVA